MVKKSRNLTYLNYYIFLKYIFLFWPRHSLDQKQLLLIKIIAMFQS